MGFVICTIVAGIMLLIGWSSRKSEEAVGFFTWVNPPKVKDVRAYNHAVAKIWFFFASVLEISGISLFFLPQNSPLAALVSVVIMFFVIGMIVVYLKIEKKYREE